MLGMIPDPYPDEITAVFHGEYAMIQPNSR